MNSSSLTSNPTGQVSRVTVKELQINYHDFGT